jgi:pimeloyl-ACP methyl ester carboxylesterase
MTQSIIFKGESEKQKIRAWSEAFRAQVPVPTEDVVVSTSFGSTHVLVAGPKTAAPPLVMFHGALASSAHAMRELGPLLETRRVYAIDVMGQSVLSEDRRVELSDDSYGRWATETVDALGLGEVDVYGISWGGFVALQTARALGSCVRHLVLLAPAGLVANGAWAGLRDAGWALLVYKMFPSDARLEKLMRAIFTDADPDWTRYFGDALACYKTDIRAPPLAKPRDLEAVRCPTLVFGAEHDVSFPGPALLERAKQLLPQAEVELLEGSRHCPPLTDPFRAKMAERIERFLAT